MAQHKTPGVYIVEKNAFPNSVVEVATAVPAFLGYTERAEHRTQSLKNIPTRLTSLTEYELHFGGPPKTRYERDDTTGTVAPEAQSQFLLYHSMRLFFDNGGTTCYIVSVGTYADETGAFTPKSGADFDPGLEALSREPEPKILVAPDAVLLTQPEWKSLSDAMFAQCVEMQSRVAIFDVYDGDKPITPELDPIQNFRNAIEADMPSFGMAYYPWLNTAVISPSEIDFRALSSAFSGALAAEITAELDVAAADGKRKTELEATIGALTQTPATPEEIKRAHETLLALSNIYRTAMAEALRAANKLPPAAAMAGVFSRTDANFGVFKAPANTGIASVLSPCVTISQDEQEDLNVPLNGKAINAIRTFAGRGVLVWGARTLDGNSQDWRYISVRRTMIFLEQSIKAAAQAYMFAPNTSETWVAVANMIRNFLNNQWKAGALAGATPDEAYQVSVGLGTTMTANDILEGYMNITVAVAISRPTEFIVMTFRQKMQAS